MKAIWYENYGGPEVLSLTDVQAPTEKENELLVRVHAATVNRTDCANLTAKPFIMRFFLGLFGPKKKILGTDFAGVVEATGSAVTKFKVGDRVFGFDDGVLSSYAELLTIAEHNAIAIIPENTSFNQAAASAEGAHYAYNILNKVEVNNKTVLVHGATGAIGSACVQLCKHFGATVTATCGNGHEGLMRELGAVRVINWQQTDFTKDQEQFDFVFDSVGKSSFGACKPLLKPKGVYISSELGPNMENIPLSLFTKYFGGKHVLFPIPFDRPKSIELMKNLLENGEFNPVIDRVLPFNQTPDAFSYVMTGEKIGNVVIQIITNPK
jgi:NADPH:quinone reductase-like Zn-dependent oxidoreductase